MNLPALAIRYRAIVITAVTLLMSWGIVQYFSMPRREDPEYTVRTCAIFTSWPGVPAEKVEELITYQIERSVDSIADVQEVRSTTTVGLSAVFVDAKDELPKSSIPNVWDKVRANVANVRMPDPGITPFVNDEYGDTNIMLLAVHQIPLAGDTRIQPENQYSLRELELHAERLRDSIRAVDGIAKVELYGEQDEAIYIETDMGTWSQLELSTAQLQQLAQARNIVATGGTIDTESGRFSLNPSGDFDSVSQLESIIVDAGTSSTSPSATLEEDIRGRTPIYLRDLGLNVVRDYRSPPAEICRFTDADHSVPCVVVALTMKSGGNITEICARVKDRIETLSVADKIIPPDIKIVAVSDQSTNVNAKLSGVVVNVIEAILIVIIVVYLIVGFRSAFVMAANIPVVILAAIAVLPSLGVDLEQISLASLIIALGLLVDNAVQVCDQSRTNQMLGMNRFDATITGTNQVSMAMLGGTATTIAAFLPMLIGLTGSKQEYIYSLPVTLSVTLGLSWLLATTFCSLLAASIIRPPADASRPSAPLPWMFHLISQRLTRKTKSVSESDTQKGGVLELFGRVAGFAISHKFATVGVAIAALYGAISLPVGSQFFPRDLRDQFVVEVWLPENVAISQTDTVVRQVEQALQKLSPTTNEHGEEVQRILGMRTFVGSGGAKWYLGRNPESRKPNYGEVLVRTTDPMFTPVLAAEVQRIAEFGDEAFGLPRVSGARIIPRQLAMGPPVDAPVGLRIVGAGNAQPGFADLKTLRRVANRMLQILRQHPDTWDVHDTVGAPGYQLRVEVDENRANLAGVSNSNVASSLNAYFSGQYLTTFREGDHQIPVYLRLPADETGSRGSLDDVDTAFVEGQNGKVPLSSIAQVTPRWEPARIERRELNRYIEVRARVRDGVLANDVVADVLASPEMKKLEAELPSGFWIEVGGEKEESDESSAQMGVCLVISVLLIVLVLVVQYNGWFKPVIILTTLPMALIGALPGLWLTGNPLGFMPQLGILSLFGIVLNTAIIFFEFADGLLQEEADKSDGSGAIAGLTREQFRNCLVEAGKQRLLPIFLTTATTVGGLIPLALSGGPLWEGMAWCMIFGLLIATVLTLLVVPALYAIFVETFGAKPVTRSEAAA